MKILKYPFTLIIRFYYKLYPSKYRIDKWKKNKNTVPPREIKFKTIQQFQKKTRFKFFIETGTYQGDTTSDAQKIFKNIFSIELDNELFQKAKYRFRRNKNVVLINGDSGAEMEKLLNVSKLINDGAVFWLDGHYSGPETAKGTLKTPILKELESIKTHISNTGHNHVILIDDAHCFNGSDDYPKLDEVRTISNNYFPNYNLNVVNNIICITNLK
jgi:hypothetical protein